MRLRRGSLRGEVPAQVNTYPLALDFKFRQAVLREEREEVAQFLHRELRLRAARLVRLLLVAAPAAPAPTAAALALVARRARALSLLLGLRPLLACGLCCAFLI